MTATHHCLTKTPFTPQTGQMVNLAQLGYDHREETVHVRGSDETDLGIRPACVGHDFNIRHQD